MAIIHLCYPKCTVCEKEFADMATTYMQTLRDRMTQAGWVKEVCPACVEKRGRLPKNDPRDSPYDMRKKKAAMRH